MLAVVGLGDEQVVYVYAQLGGIEAVESMFGVDEGGDASGFLGLGDGVDGQRGLTGRFGAVDFDDTAAGITAYTQGHVQSDGAGGDDFHLLDVVVAHFHDGAFSEALFYLVHGGLQGFQLFAVGRCGTFVFKIQFVFFCHTCSFG